MPYEHLSPPVVPTGVGNVVPVREWRQGIFRCVGGDLSAGRRLCWPYPKGREARRTTGGAVDQVRTGHQRSGRQDAWSHSAGQAARCCRRGDRVRRREFITLLGGAATWPLAAWAQQAAVPVVGLLSSVTARQWAPFVSAFLQGLNELGFVEGKNVVTEQRWAGGQYDRLPAMAA